MATKKQVRKLLNTYLNNWTSLGFTITDDLIYRIDDNEILTGISFERLSNNDIRPLAVVQPLYFKYKYIILDYSIGLREYINTRESYKLEGDIEELFKFLNENFLKYYLPWIKERNSSQKFYNTYTNDKGDAKFLSALRTNHYEFAKKEIQRFLDFYSQYIDTDDEYRKGRYYEYKLFSELLEKNDYISIQNILDENIKYTREHLGV